MKLKHTEVDKVKPELKEVRGKHDIFVNLSTAMEMVTKRYSPLTKLFFNF